MYGIVALDKIQDILDIYSDDLPDGTYREITRLIKIAYKDLSDMRDRPTIPPPPPPQYKRIKRARRKC